MQTNTIGSSNTAVGSAALSNNTIGINNAALGNGALGVNTIGSNNIAVGSLAGTALVTGSNNIYIGNVGGGAAEAATIRVGTAGTQTRFFAAGIRGVVTGIADAIPVLIDSAGQLGTVSSSRRFKHNIQDMNAASANIYGLRPVTFVYNGDQSETRQYGLIAEEVEGVFPSIVVKDEIGQPETVQYHVLPILLLNEMKKQHADIRNLNATVAAMNVVINTLQSQIKDLLKRIK